MIPTSGHIRPVRRDRPVLDEQEAFSCEAPERAVNFQVYTVKCCTARCTALEPAFTALYSPLLQHFTARDSCEAPELTSAAATCRSLRPEVAGQVPLNSTLQPALQYFTARFTALYSPRYSTLQPALHCLQHFTARARGSALKPFTAPGVPTPAERSVLSTRRVAADRRRGGHASVIISYLQVIPPSRIEMVKS
jgi:hypothetical protein